LSGGKQCYFSFMTTAPTRLADRYDLAKSRVFLTGPQAMVRLMLAQKALDEKAGLNTAAYITGYRGSPVGGVDQAFTKAADVLVPKNIKFQSGLNEDLAATALWGTQQAEARGEGAYDGVFGAFYAKGPGIDRSGDVFRHANAAGTSKHGGVLVFAGDDHGAESSTVPHQSEFALLDAMMPVLHPAGLQELFDYGLLGYALSRFSGNWVGIKCVHDTVESTAVIDAGLDRVTPVIPHDFAMPPGGLNLRAPDDRFDQERRLHVHKREAAVAFARVNNLNRITLRGGPHPKIGVVSTGKSYLDVLQALEELGIDEVKAAKIGLRLLKVGMVWPLDHDIVAEFAKGLDLIIVVEEKRLLLETHVREVLFNDRTRPIVVGKDDEEGRILFPPYGTLEPNQIAVAIGERILKRKLWPDIKRRVDEIKTAMGAGQGEADLAARVPYFCAGCPHNSSTVLPEDARGYAGIGCHWMVQFVPGRHTEGATQMGGEGANWIGEAPFSKRRHVFQNLGDGTYNHSGLLAIRAAVTSGVNITYKILFNDAVAMTGGQPNDGDLSVAKIASQVRAEGVERIAIVSDEPNKYTSADHFPSHVSFHHRDDLQAVQKEFMEVPGTSVLIYDQTCAAEKRRRRKRGAFPDPNKRIFINEAVCEGCGDCGVQSNCVAIMPVETPLGRKRQIDQSACNKDYSCVKGFCPSFVSVEGGELIRGQTKALPPVDPQSLPDPVLPSLERPWSMLVTGIGGTGVVTIGHVLGMAAHLEGKGAAMIDMVGLAQKNGAVVTHLKLAARPEDIAAVRVAAGTADLVLGCDLVTSASERILSACSPVRSYAVVNLAEVMPAQFTHNADFRLPGSRMRKKIAERVKPQGLHAVDATQIATKLLGDTIAANMFTLGYAFQKGLVPIGAKAIEDAITLNGAAIPMNIGAFRWGRAAAHDLAAVEDLVKVPPQVKPAETLQDIVARHAAFLTEYQNEDYAETYRAFIAKVTAREAALHSDELSKAVARYLFKLMAYKDEYEVARLYSGGQFAETLGKRFKGGEVHYYLSPPLLARIDPVTGHPRKIKFGPWMGHVFKLLAGMKGLRGTAFDPFGRTEERRTERALIQDYRQMVERLLEKLTAQNLPLAVEIAKLPEHIRGFGHVKQRHLAETRERQAVLLKAFLEPETPQPLLKEAAE
jgi:indolepyruvate ferredoxin oxidoreductase